MTKLKHLKDKAIELRGKGYSLTDICKRLNKGKSTIYYWIKDAPIINKNVFLSKRNLNFSKRSLSVAKATRKKFKKIHEYYRDRALWLWKDNLSNNEDFRLFIMLYSCEGDRKSRYSVGLCNSDPNLVVYCNEWFKVLNIHNKAFEYNVQIHVDQDEGEVIFYWKNLLSVPNVRVSRKSNTGKMHKRNWNSKYGVITIRFCDSYLKTMLITWGDLLKKELSKKVIGTDMRNLVLPYTYIK